MRWSLRRGPRQHWTLRLLQIAQATYLSVMFVIIALEGPAVVQDRVIWFWAEVVVIAWITLLMRLGWAATWMQVAAWFAVMIPVVNRSRDEAEKIITLPLAAAITGFMIGLVLDLCHFGERLELSGSNADSTPAPNDQ